MRVKDLTKLINNQGTCPRISVLCYRHYLDNDPSNSAYNYLIYEGSPDNISKEVGQLKVNSFTIRGVGFLEIFAERV